MRRGFTLIELLIVIAIVAVLAVTVILTLNPAQLLAQARDMTRVSDLATTRKAIALLQTESSQLSMGSSSVVYVSIPHTSPTCTGLGLPALPSGWSYSCKTTSTYRNVNGTGWIPVNFASFSSGAPFGSLPVDPTNTTASYLTYVTDGLRYELTAAPESERYSMAGGSDITSRDGGQYPELHEIGSANLTPMSRGDDSLLALWSFEEASGTTVFDRSGLAIHGMASGTGALRTTGKIGSSSGLFNGTDNFIDLPLNTALGSTGMTISTWFRTSSANAALVGHYLNSSIYVYRLQVAGSKLRGCFITYPDCWSTGNQVSSTVNVNDDAWHLATMTYSGSEVKLYLDGTQVDAIAKSAGTIPAGALLNSLGVAGYKVSGVVTAQHPFLTGAMDDVRFYNRALSAGEVQALYNSAQ